MGSEVSSLVCVDSDTTSSDHQRNSPRERRGFQDIQTSRKKEFAGGVAVFGDAQMMTIMKQRPLLASNYLVTEPEQSAEDAYHTELAYRGSWQEAYEKQLCELSSLKDVSVTPASGLESESVCSVSVSGLHVESEMQSRSSGALADMIRASKLATRSRRWQ